MQQSFNDDKLNGCGKPNSMLRFSDMLKNKDLNENDIHMICDEYDKLPSELADLIYAVFEKRLSISEIVKRVNADNFDVYYIKMEKKDDFLRVFMAYFEVDNDILSKAESEWLSKIAYFFITSDIPMNDMMVVTVFIMYSSLLMDCMVAEYNNLHITDENVNCFPKNVQLAYFCYEASVAFDNGDAKKCEHFINMVSSTDNKLTNVASAMGKIFRSSFTP